MPDFSMSIKIDGEYYCWDFEKEQFAQADLKYLDNSQVPPKVIAAFMNNMRGKPAAAGRKKHA